MPIAASEGGPGYWHNFDTAHPGITYTNLYYISRIGQTSNQSRITQRLLQYINPIEDVWVDSKHVNTGNWHSSRCLQCTNILRAGVTFYPNFCWLTIFQKISLSKHHWLEVMTSTSNLCEKCHLKYLIMERFSWWSVDRQFKVCEIYFPVESFHMDIDVKRRMKSVLLQCLVN